MRQMSVLRRISTPPWGRVARRVERAFDALLRCGVAALFVAGIVLFAAPPAWANHDNNEHRCPDLRFAVGSGVGGSGNPVNWIGVDRVPVYYIPGTARSLSGTQPPRPRDVTWVAGQPITPITFTVPRSYTSGTTRLNGVQADGWSISPPLPAGLTLTSESATDGSEPARDPDDIHPDDPRTGTFPREFIVRGIISGTPESGLSLDRREYTVTARNCHGTGQPATIIVSVVSGAPQLTQPDPPIARSGAVGTPFETLTFANTGGRVDSWETFPVLPEGMNIDPVTGAISGTPREVTPMSVGRLTQCDPSSGCPYTVTAENGAGRSQVTFNLLVTQAPDIVNVQTPVNALVGTAIAPIQFVNRGAEVAAGAGREACSVSPALPSGLAVAASGGSCRISGTPQAAAASAEYTVTARNAAGDDPTPATVRIAVQAAGTGGIVVSIRRTDSGDLLESPGGTPADFAPYEAVFAITLDGPALTANVDIPFTISGDRLRLNDYLSGSDLEVAACTDASGTSCTRINRPSDAMRRATPAQHSSTGRTDLILIVVARGDRVFESREPFTVTLGAPTGPAANQVRLSASQSSASAAIAGDAGTFTAGWNVNPGVAGGMHFGRESGSSDPSSWTVLAEGQDAVFEILIRVEDEDGIAPRTSESPMDFIFQVAATDYPAPYNSTIRDNPPGRPDLGTVTGPDGATTEIGPVSYPAGSGRVRVANGFRVRFAAGASQFSIRIPVLDDGIAEPLIPALEQSARTDVHSGLRSRAVGNVELRFLGAEPVVEGAPAPRFSRPTGFWPIAASGEVLEYALSGPTQLAGTASGAYTVTLRGASGGLPEQQVITWTVSAGSGANPATAADFGGTFPTGSLTFAEGASSVDGMSNSMSFNIAATGAGADNRNEADKTFVVTLSTTADPAPRFSNNGLQVGVTDPDAISVSLARMDSGDLAEGAADTTGNAVFTVTLSDAQLTADASIPYTISGAGITAADVSATGLGSGTLSGTLTIPSSASTSTTTTADITVTALDDNLNEGMETLTVTLGGTPTTAGAIALTDTVADRSATANIAASNPITVSIAAPSPATVEEGQSVQFTVTLSGASAGSVAAITVPYTADGTTDTPTDANDGSIEIAAGQTTGTITLAIPSSLALDDSSPDETLSVELGTITVGTSGGTVRAAASPGNSASVTVSYITAAHTFSFTNPAASITEGASVTYTVARTGPAITGAAGIVLSWAYAAGATDPASAADFAGGNAPAGGTLTFTGNETTETFTITTADDALSEPGETFTLSLSAAPEVLTSEGGVALPATGLTVTIAESDRPVTVQLTAPTTGTLGTAQEGQAADFTVSFAEAVDTTAPVAVTWTITFPAVSDMNPASAADFAATTGTFEIPAGSRTATLSVTSADDAVNEGMESYIVTLTNAQGGGAIAAPTLHSSDSNIRGMASISASDPVRISGFMRRAGQTGAVREGNEAEFTVSLVLATATAPSATSGGDICVEFETTVLSQMPHNDDTSGPDLGGITDCNGAAVVVSDRFSNTPSGNNGGVLIPAGQSSATFSIRARFDGVEETANEDMTVTLSAVTPRAGAGGASLPTRDMDREQRVSIENVNSLRTLEVSAAALTGDEDSASMPGGEAAFVSYTVRIEGEPLSEEVSVNWTLAGADGANLPGAAASGSGSSGLARQHGGDHTPDFGAATVAEAGGGTVNADGISGTLIFPVGATPVTRTVRVPLIQDALNEGAERLTLTVSDPCPATGVCTLGGGGGGASMTPALQLGTGSQDATIPASDPAMLRITRVGSGTVVSGEGITYQVSLGTTFLNGQSVPVLASAPLTVMVPLRVGGADSGQSFTVEVPTGQSSGQAEVPDTVIATALSGQTGTPMLSLGMASVTGAPGPSGGAAEVTAPDPTSTDPTVLANLPAPVQTAAWELSRTAAAAEAPEGGSYEITFTLRGSETPAGGLSFDWSVTGSAATDGGAPAVAADFARAAGYPCGAAAVGAMCTSLPRGTVTFTAGNTSQTIAIAVRDDSADNLNEGRTPDGMIRAEGFTLTFNELTGTDVGRVEYAPGADLPGTLQVDIPALRADLSVADATAAEGASAVFRVALSGFVGGDATIQPVVVSYRVGVDAAGAALPGDTATLGADYTAAETSLTLPAGESSGTIAIPLVLDGVLEPRETFTLTITGATGGGGTIRLVPDPSADPVVVENEISATGTITDDADQGARRRQRVGALVTVLDRQTALLATDAISARLSRARTDSAQTASLSIANRNLLGARNTARSSASAAGAGGAQDIGLALYGAAGQDGAAAGLPGTGGKSAAGRSAALSARGSAGAAFGGLGAGLAGNANLGTRTALPTLSQVLNGSSFRFGAASDVLAGLADFADGIEVWGSGGYVDLRSESRSSGLTYDGESLAAFIGADAAVPQLPNLLAGLAVGWSAGDLDFTDRAGGFTMRGKLENNALSVHPYFGWQLSPHANAWLVLGIGTGSVDIEENEGSGADAISRKLDGGDSSMLMFSTGITGTQQIGETGDLKLRFALTRVHSRVDSGNFDDGALLPKTRGRSLRIGGEAEAGRRIALDNGLSLRPFGTLRVRLDNASTDSGVENAAMDWGAGIAAAWSDLGLDGRFAFRRQLNDTGDEEQGVSLDVNFAPGATGQGIAISLQSALQQRRPGLSSLDGNLGDALLGANSALNNPFGNTNSAGAGMQHSLSGEIAYGVALRYFGRSDASRAALLTPYGRFHLGNADTRWAAGLRLAEPGGLQLGLEAGLDLNSAATAGGAAASPRSYDLLLTGRLNF